MITSKSIQKQNGVVVFTGTDIEISSLFNYLKAGKSTENFLNDYREVTLAQVLDVLEMADDYINSTSLTE
ncbi:MAG: DUF433 domain-containing protein [Sphingobacteriaceae bacterium]|nr:MAG: DUF433 domain-containing protein [Sphingobacteriaceae bacterium]